MELQKVYNPVSKRNILLFLILCSISVLLLYQFRVQSYTVQFLSWNVTEHNSTLSYDTKYGWRPPSPASGYQDVIRNQTGQFLTGNATKGNSRLLSDTIYMWRPPSPVYGYQDAIRNMTIQTDRPKASNLSRLWTTALKPPICKDPFREEYVKQRNFICCHPAGKLGNNMFIYASAYGIASKLNRTVVLNKNVIFYNLFNLKAKLVDDYECVIRGSKGRNAPRCCVFDNKMFAIPNGNNFCVGRFLQSYRYFDHVKEDIRKQFTFKKKQKTKAQTIVDAAIKTFHNRFNKTDHSSRPVVVGVHVRRGDFVQNKAGFQPATPEYMGKALKYFRTKYTHVLFIVCSNGMDWAKKHVQGDDVIYVEGNNYDVDMAVLVSCDHTISTVGSFSWWAGYLTRGETTYYQWPAREGSLLRKHFRYSEYFPPTWKGMS